MGSKILFLSLSILLEVNIYASDRIVCDFTQGVPDNFTLVDNDGNEPSAGAAKYGFKKGIPWVQYFDAAENNYVACSTSWYKSAGTSDDWMILPVLSVNDGSVLKWRSKDADAKYRDGYSVYLSVNGISISSFDKSHPLFAVSEDKAEWTEHSVDLSAYKGKDVYIAFVNNSTDKSRLYIDDIFAGKEKVVALSVNIPYVVSSGDRCAVSGEVFTENNAEVKGFRVYYSLDGITHSLNFDDSTLVENSRQKFSFPDSFSIKNGMVDTIKVWATHHDDVDTVNCAVRSMLRYFVAEEYTGTWCPWCVRGIVAMKEMNAVHDDFIGIAVHSLHDPMAITEYENAQSSISNVGSNGYPDVVINRCSAYEGDPKNISDFYDMAKKQPMEAAIALQVKYDASAKSLTVNTSTYFNNNLKNSDIRIAYLLKEDSVHHPNDSRYNQQNAYSGGETEMGGFEKLPTTISSSDVYYMDVARCVKDDAFGVASCFPSTIYGGQKYDNTYVFPLPDNVDAVAKTTLVVMLINKSNGLILNSNRLRLSDIVMTGLSETFTNPYFFVSKEENHLSFTISSEQPISNVAVYDMAGRKVHSDEPRSCNCKISVRKKGLYIMDVTVRGKHYIRKMVM